MGKGYDPRDWYWLDEAAGEVYSSRRQALVPTTDMGYRDFIADGTTPTRHPGDAELAEVLRPYGVALYSEPALAKARREKRAALLTLFAAKQAAGIVYAGKPLQLRDEDLPRIEGAAVQAFMVASGLPGLSWPAGFAWRMGDNSFLPLPTASTMIDLAAAAASAYGALRQQLWALKDAIDAAATPAEVEAIDVEGGW